MLLASGVPALANEDVPESLSTAVQEAVEAWGEFTVSGDVADLSPFFVPGGPQWQQLEAESVDGNGSLPVEPPLHLEIVRMRLRSHDPAVATVWAEVEASRPGYQSEVFGWDFDLVRRQGRWRVWTVVGALEPPVSEPQRRADSAAANGATSTTRPTAPTAPAEPRVTENEATILASPDRSSGTRIPALSAWIIVVTIIGVTAAGYLAPRLDQRGER